MQNMASAVEELELKFNIKAIKKYILAQNTNKVKVNFHITLKIIFIS